MKTSIACPKQVPDGIVRKREDTFTRAIKEPAFIKGMKELLIAVLYRYGKEMEDYILYSRHF